MTESWATFGADLHLELGTGGQAGGAGGRGVRAGLVAALREAVRSGRLAAGTRLPSSRQLAADLGVARNTVADAYAELVAAGWLTARQGSGTRVAARPVPPARPPERTGPAYSLVPGSPDLAGFPRAAWLAAARRALTEAPHEAFGYGDPRGRNELRVVLAEYLARARGVYADPGRVVTCAGFVHGLQLLGRVLLDRGVRAVGVDPYTLDIHRDLLAGAGLTTVPVEPSELPGEGVGAVLLTPAHQFPTGSALSAERRAELVGWARESGGWLLEDDYDGEFRYDRQLVGALQGLDPERVVYFGTASKSLAPGLRIGWLVVPAALLDEVVGAKGLSDWTSSALEQLTLAQFMASGAYDRHVRAMRLRYRRRRDQLCAALAEGAPHVRVSGVAAGLHAVLELPPGTERSVVAAAAGLGLRVEGLSRYRHPDSVRPPRSALVVGYASPPDSAWSPTLSTLCAALRATGPHGRRNSSPPGGAAQPPGAGRVRGAGPG
ncbi:PLP-dependent aminotransferase family protein [Streptomyces bambusae]|uniref:MocR-like pyridoxine biosynthesis transcription factor PdxR n=1 Tax=Streptomyces bambusae TaxID=1550616 RepID=UPI001CFF8801|nr:PLP-dependent aminotransferase family protein [Streptomyces bambusae]MCB5169982.1 PLP-dependent aminotransferase family protein [Streptomyces bambusae]